jgi:DegV family protein with EDD domain
MKIKVAAISTSCLDSYNEKEEYKNDIDLIRIKIIIDNKEYIDGQDIKPLDFYDLLKKNPKLVTKTSQPSLGELISYFENLSKKGYKEVFITVLSDKFSGTYNTILQAKKMVANKIKVIPYNTNTIAFSEGFFAIEAYRLFKEGLSVESVIEHLNFFKNNNTIFFVVNSLNRLIKSGRLTKTKSFFGRLFRIKPILKVNNKGQAEIIEKKIKLEKAFYFITEQIKNFTKDKKFMIHILFTQNDKFKEKFKFILEKELKLENILEIPISVSIGLHIGDNVFGVGIILKK